MKDVNQSTADKFYRITKTFFACKMQDKCNLIPLLIVCFTLTCLSVPSAPSFAEDDIEGNIAILFHSRTGKTRLVCEALQNQLGADSIEIKDLYDRSEAWGFITASADAFLHRHTPIEPEYPDIASYPFIIVASPIWSWSLSTPIHTLFIKNSFDGKKIVMLTTANIHIMKYEHYGDDASFIKRFFKKYLRGKRDLIFSEVVKSGGKFVGHHHIATQNKTDADILEETLKIVPEIRKQFLLPSSHSFTAEGKNR